MEDQPIGPPLPRSGIPFLGPACQLPQFMENCGIGGNGRGELVRMVARNGWQRVIDNNVKGSTGNGYRR